MGILEDQTLILENNLETALLIIKEAKPMLSSFGWMISLYGSVLEKDNQKDIDLMIVNKFDKVEVSAVLLVFKRLGFEQISDVCEGLFSNGSVVFKRGKCILDIQIRKANLKFSN